MNLSNKKITLKINKNLYLKTLEEKKCSKKYVNWLNDYEITKFTEQKNYKHNISSIKSFVKKKNFHRMKYYLLLFSKKITLGI